MKRKFFGFVCLSLALALLSSCSTKEYDKDLIKAYQTLEATFSKSTDIHVQMKKIVNTSFEKSQEPQNREKDILVILSDLANEQYDIYEKEGIFDQMSDGISALQIQTATLKNPPIPRKDCYADFMLLASDVCQFADETLRILKARYSNPVEFSKNSYMIDHINQSLSDFKLKYADILQGM